MGHQTLTSASRLIPSFDDCGVPELIGADAGTATESEGVDGNCKDEGLGTTDAAVGATGVAAAMGAVDIVVTEGVAGLNCARGSAELPATTAAADPTPLAVDPTHCCCKAAETSPSVGTATNFPSLARAYVLSLPTLIMVPFFVMRGT